MEQIKIGETVVRRLFVTVKWPSWLGRDAYESTHPPNDLVRLIA